MSTRESDVIARLRAIRERDQADNNSTSGAINRMRQVRARDGTLPTVAPVSRERDDVGVFGQFARGAALGAIEPFAFLDPVEGAVASLKAAEPDSGAEKAARITGNLAGFLLPFAPAMRIGGVAARGVGLVARADRVMEIADMSTHAMKLSAAGRFVQGGIAGGLLTAGAEADTTQDRILNTALAASAFGVGDAILPIVGKAVWGMFPTGRITKEINKTLRNAIEAGEIGSVVEASMLGRATAVANELFPERALAGRGIAAQREAIEQGLGRMFSSDLIPGQVRVVPGLIREAGTSMDKILAKLPGVEFAAVRPPTARGTSTTVDYLVAPQGTLRKEIIEEYAEQGFLRGQRVAIDGNDWTITGYRRGNKRVTLEYQGKTKTVAQSRLAEEGILGPVAAWTIPKVKEAPNLWSKYLDDFGLDSARGFEQNFDDFVKLNNVAPDQVAPLREYFVNRFAVDLAKIAPEEMAMLRRLKAMPGLRGEDLEDPLAVLRIMAAQQGFHVHQAVPLSPASTAKNMFQLVDAYQAGNKLSFPNVQSTMAYLRENPRGVLPSLSDLVPGLTLPEELLFGYEGAAVQLTRAAAGTGGMHRPQMNSLDRMFAPVTPRLSAIRNFANQLSQATNGEFDATGLWGALSSLQIAMGQARNAMGPFIKDLTKIRGRTWNQRIRPEKMSAVNDLIEAPSSGFQYVLPDGSRARPVLRDQIIKNAGLNEQEIKVADEMRGWWERLFDDISNRAGISASSQEYLQVYAPALRNMEHDAALEYLKTTLGTRFNQNLFDLISRIDESGLEFAYQYNPIEHAAKFLRGSMMKIHAGQHQVAANTQVNQILEFFGKRWNPVTNKVVGATGDDLAKAIAPEVRWEGSPYEQLFNMSKEYLAASRGGAPEQWYAVRIVADDFLKNTGIRLQERDVDKLVNTVMSLNYGAFMGFRPALAVRNMVQPFVTTYPMVGAKYLAHGIRASFSRSTYEKWQKAGAVVQNAHAPFLEEIWMSDLAHIARTSGTKRGRVVELGSKTLESARALSQASLSGRGAFYTKADVWNRVVSAEAQRKKTLDAWNKYMKHGDVDRFNQESGLQFLGGESMTNKFWELAKNGEQPHLNKALDWSGVQMANETQWIYQSGAGPSIISQGIWKMAGQYGTWPAWYLEHFRRGITRGLFYGEGGFRNQITNPDRLKFMLRTGIMHGAIMGAGATTGLALYRWSPLASMAFGGGPMVEVGKDMSAIVGGRLTTGGSTAERMLVLGKYGLVDTGRGVTGIDAIDVLPFTEFLPIPNRGVDIRASDGWQRLFTNGPGKLIPGSLLVNDFNQAMQQRNTPAMVLRALGFSMRAQGSEWGALNF